MKVLIVGAGVAGLAVGWRLATAGIAVEILERGLAGRGATWASAGMIASGAELGTEENPTAQFAREARAKWPDFARDLEAASLRRIDYRQTGSLRVAQSPMRARALENQATGLARDGVAATWVPAAELRRREPLLSADLLGALHIEGDGQVDNRALSDALCAALTNSGGVLREHCAVRALAIQNGRAVGVVTADGVLASDIVVLACGAWMNLIGGIGADDLPPVKPAKGQMAACEAPAATALPQALIWADDVYLVPRGRRLFIGATVEDANFDTSVSRQARDNLLAAAWRIVPSLERWRLAEMWAGLRPRTPDDAPVLGATGAAGLFVAGGQFRNGILFAPAVADAICGLVLGRPGHADYRAFDPRRFAVP
jgi:glycine oxidase